MKAKPIFVIRLNQKFIEDSQEQIERIRKDLSDYHVLVASGAILDPEFECYNPQDLDVNTRKETEEKIKNILKEQS